MSVQGQRQKKEKGETNLNGARAAVDGGGKPVDRAIAGNQDVDVESNIKLTVVTVDGSRNDLYFYLLSVQDSYPKSR